jgi:putative membrane protein
MFISQFLKSSVLYVVFAFTTVVGTIGCGSDQQVDSKQIAMDLNKPKNDIAKEQDERFLVSIAEFNYEQILLGKLAYQRATSGDIKEFAKMMEDAHRTSKSELGSLGILKSIAVPSTPTKAAHAVYDKVNAVSVDEFDAAYLTQVIASHNDAIRLFEQCIGANHDPDIRNWAITKLPDLRTHLAKAMDLDAASGPLSEVIR